MLHYLDFDAAEDDAGNQTWDALACVDAAHLAPLQAEICAVLAWAHRQFPGGCAPLDDGGLWDVDLQCERANQPLQPLHYDAGSGRLLPPIALGEGERATLSLTLCCVPALAADFEAALQPAD